MSDDGAAAAQYVGRTVGGRFQLQSLLGEGGMASVYLAYDSVLDRQVAVKTLHTDLGREQSFRERFRREAQSVAKLTHSNIVSVFDSGEDEIDGAMVPYIVMEYVEGKPLRAVLDEAVAQSGAMPADRALKITGDVLAALEVSHEMGLVHRDIKPGNVMVTKRGVVKVMDFGIARAMQSGVTSMTQTGMVVGTPQYLSPEQALGRGVDARSDLYSVGIMLFELLTGRLPFDADSPLAIAYAHVQEEPVPPSSVNQSVPPAVDAIVARSLRKNPNERYPNAEGMHDEAEQVRTSGAASGASPAIVAGNPAQSGAGVGQSVFPPLGPDGTPAPGQQQTYQQFQGGFGPSTPPPHGQPTYNTPAGFGGPQGGQTPPPYVGAPGGSQGGGGGKNNAVIIGSTVTAIVAVTAVIVAVVLTSGGGDSGQQADDKPSPSVSQSTDDGGDGEDKRRFQPTDTSKTIDVEQCTDPLEGDAKGTVAMPDLRFHTLSSVKKCIQKAGWKVGEIEWKDAYPRGKNMVVKHTPDEYEDLHPDTGEIDLTVSTGYQPKR